MAQSYNGANQTVKIGKQTAQGTVASTLKELACKPATAGLQFDSIKYENSTGSRVGGKDKIGGQAGKLSIPAQLEAKSNGHLFAALMGSAAVNVLVPAKVGEHTFTLQTTSTPRFYTVEIGQDGKFCTQIKDAVCQSASIEFAAGSYVDIGTDWIYGDEAEIAYHTYTKFAPVAVAAQAGTINVAGSAPEELIAFSLNINNNTKADKKGLNNGGKPVAILHGNLDITGKFSVVYNDNTKHFIDKFKAATEFALAVTIDTGEVIDTTYNYKFMVAADKMVITEIQKSADAPMLLDVSFKIVEATNTLSLKLQNDAVVAY